MLTSSLMDASFFHNFQWWFDNISYIKYQTYMQDKAGSVFQ